MLGIFHCQQNSKLCLGDVTEREKVQWVSFFSIKISWNWKTGSQRQKLFCVAVRLLCVKSHKASGLVLFGHLVISFEAPLLFSHCSLTPTYLIPHWASSHQSGEEWRRRVCRHDEECSSREQGRKEGGSEAVTEEVTHTSSHSSQMGVSRQQHHSSALWGWAWVWLQLICFMLGNRQDWVPHASRGGSVNGTK